MPNPKQTPRKFQNPPPKNPLGRVSIIVLIKERALQFISKTVNEINELQWKYAQAVLSVMMERGNRKERADIAKHISSTLSPRLQSAPQTVNYFDFRSLINLRNDLITKSNNDQNDQIIDINNSKDIKELEIRDNGTSDNIHYVNLDNLSTQEGNSSIKCQTNGHNVKPSEEGRGGLDDVDS